MPAQGHVAKKEHRVALVYVQTPECWGPLPMVPSPSYQAGFATQALSRAWPHLA